MKQQIPNAPGPGFFGGLNSLRRFRADPLAELPRIHKQYGDIARLPYGPLLINLVSKPEYVQHFLAKSAQKYQMSQMYDSMKPLLGQGLLTTDGDHWLAERRALQPEFKRDKISAMSAMFVRETEATSEEIARQADADQPVDIARSMMHLTFQIIGQALAGSNLSAHADQMYSLLETAMIEVVDRASSPLPLPIHWPTPSNNRYRRSVAGVRQIVDGMIAERRALDAGNRPHDFLSTLIANHEARGAGPDTDEIIRDQAITFISAGHETTANALAWTWYLLSQHPEHDERLREECRSVLNGRAPGLEDLGRLPFAEQVINESMRLYPPVWFISRQATVDDEIGGYHIPRGSIVASSQWQVHRHPDLWENPDRFDPDRFSAERSAGRERLAFFPFGAGQKMCIGEHFAMLEAQIILITLIQRFRMRLVPNHVVKPEPLVTMRPRHGLPMQVERIE